MHIHIYLYIYTYLYIVQHINAVEVEPLASLPDVFDINLHEGPSKKDNLVKYYRLCLDLLYPFYFLI